MSMEFIESSLEGYGADFLTPEDMRYLHRYWLTTNDLKSKWGEILKYSFVVRDSEVSIAPGRAVDVRMGGVLFVENEFIAFKSSAIQSGAKEMVVIEDIGQQNWSEILSLSFFRFSFPLSIGWDGIAKSCPLAEDVFLRPIRAFFVVTDNGRTGKYVNNDADPPYEILFETGTQGDRGS